MVGSFHTSERQNSGGVVHNQYTQDGLETLV